MTWPKIRPPAAEEGYGPDHRRTRAQWANVIADTGWPCARGCGTIIRAHHRWCLDHADDRASYLGPSCEVCNLAAAARASHANRPDTRRKRPPSPGLIHQKVQPLMATASPADVEYLQAMLEHHQEAVTMSQDYLSKSSAGRLAVVGDLARGVITAQTAEIKQMGGWLKAAGAPLTSPNPGMDKGESGSKGMSH